MQLGLGVPVSANGTIKLGYAATDNEAKKADVKAYQIGYEHNLSKRINPLRFLRSVYPTTRLPTTSWSLPEPERI